MSKDQEIYVFLVENHKGKDNAAGVGVNTLGLVEEGVGVDQLVSAGHVGTAHLEAVAVTGIGAIFQVTVGVSNTVADGNRADGAGINLGVQIPTVVSIVVSHTAVEYVALAAGQLGGEAVSILVAGVSIAVRGTVEDQVVAGPFAGQVAALSAAKLDTGVTVVVSIHIVNDTVAAAQVEARLAIGRRPLDAPS